MVTEQQVVSIRPEADGLIAVFDVAAKKWRRVHMVDAREQLELGLSTLDGPGTPPPARVRRPPTRVVQGARAVARVAETPLLAGSDILDADLDADLPRLDKAPIERLREIAKERGIAGSETMSKPKILEALK